MLYLYYICKRSLCGPRDCYCYDRKSLALVAQKRNHLSFCLLSLQSSVTHYPRLLFFFSFPTFSAAARSFFENVVEFFFSESRWDSRKMYEILSILFLHKNRFWQPLLLASNFFCLKNVVFFSLSVVVSSHRGNLHARNILLLIGKCRIECTLDFLCGPSWLF